MLDAAQLAVLIGIANGVVLLLKPIARIHIRIDAVERGLRRLENDVDGLLKVSGMSADRED